MQAARAGAAYDSAIFTEVVTRMKAIIPAAGLERDSLPSTKSVPKEMLPVLDRPVIQHVAEEALAAPGL